MAYIDRNGGRRRKILLAAAAGQFVPGALDSIQVRLERDVVELHARLDTRRVPLSFGPLSGIIRDHNLVAT